jgi:hypothetical protein
MTIKTLTKTHIKSITKGNVNNKTLSKSKTKKQSTKKSTKQSTKQSTLNSVDNIEDSFSFEIGTMSKPLSIKKTKKRFHTRPKTIYHIDRNKIISDDFIELLDDYLNVLLKQKTYKGKNLDNLIFSNDENKCICTSLQLQSKTAKAKPKDKYNNSINDKCSCDNLISIKKKTLLPFTLSKKYIIQCKKKILNSGKSTKTNSNFIRKDLYLKTDLFLKNIIKFINKNGDYIFLRLNNSAHEILINKYIYELLPLNTIGIVESGKCGINSYILYNEGNLESFTNFFKRLYSRELDDEFDIHSSEIFYKVIVNLLLQVVLIYGHLNTSNINFIHNKYLPINLMIKRVPNTIVKKFNYIINTKNIKVKNLGFSVVVANIQDASISLKSNKYSNKYSNNNKYVLLPKSLNPKSFINMENNDISLYIFFNTIINKKSIFGLNESKNKYETIEIKKYFQEKKLDQTILGFINNKIILDKIGTISNVSIIKLIKKQKNLNTNNLFNGNYIKILDLLNYHLFP